MATIAPVYYEVFPNEDRDVTERRVDAHGHQTAFTYAAGDTDGITAAVWACTCGEHGRVQSRKVSAAGNRADAAIRAHRAEAHPVVK